MVKHAISAEWLRGEDLLPMQNGYMQRRSITRVVQLSNGSWKAYDATGDYYYMPEYVQKDEDVEYWWKHGTSAPPVPMHRMDPDEDCPSA